MYKHTDALTKVFSFFIKSVFLFLVNKKDYENNFGPFIVYDVFTRSERSLRSNVEYVLKTSFAKAGQGHFAFTCVPVSE